jgi:hypothetical protein
MGAGDDRVPMEIRIKNLVYERLRVQKAAWAKSCPYFEAHPHQQSEPIRGRNDGKPLGDIARSYNVSQATISRLTD